MNLSLHRVRQLLTRPASRALVGLMVVALLLASASRFGFHAHVDAAEGHNHHHAFPALVDHPDGAPHPGDGDGDGSAATAVLHGHDLGTVATLTMPAATAVITPAPSATVLATAAPPPDSGPSAPPIRPPIA